MDQSAFHINNILSLLSVGILQLEQTTQQSKTTPLLPLNPTLRQGWEQLCYQCFYVGELPPRTLTELIHWLNMPTNQWPVLGKSLVEPEFNLPLIEDGEPSTLCVRLGSPYMKVYNLQQELEDDVFRQIHELCYKLGDPALYTTVRTFINRNVVLEDAYASITANADWPDEIRGLLSQCYQRIPVQCVRKDVRGQYIVLCPHCGWPLEWNRRHEAGCYTGGPCTEMYGDLSESQIWKAYNPGMARTTEGIQRYVAAPEKSLLELVDALSSLWGIRLSLYPQLDAYDLLIEFINGQRWAVDLKDHKQAARLAIAINLKPFKYDPSWDRAFYVFPNYRANEVYLNEFANAWMPEKGVQFMKLRKFIAWAKQEAGA